MATPEQYKKLLRRRTSSTKKGGEKNPYSDRGVEKFSELLAEIEEKKRMIYSQFNPEEVSVIRFVHAGNNKLRPVVVRANSTNKLALKNNQEFEPSKMKMQEIDPKFVLEDQKCDGDQEKEELKLKKPEIVELVGADDRKEEEESLSLMEVMKLQAWSNSKGIGGVILVLLLVVVFGRYFLLQLQARVCPRIQNLD